MKSFMQGVSFPYSRFYRQRLIDEKDLELCLQKVSTQPRILNGGEQSRPNAN